jgi:stringent starvation protein B
MTPSRPYLIRAFYDWITDNSLTPYLLVDATFEGVEVPQEYVEGGRIVLNVSPSAVHALHLGNDEIQFNARFGGSPRQLSFPPRAVLAIYARENGQGTLFNNDQPEGPDDEQAAKKPAAKRGKKRPGLKVVK